MSTNSRSAGLCIYQGAAAKYREPASHFVNIYHRVLDSYLLVDREAETSIKYFAVQLFTVPSIALHIVRQLNNIINRLLSIITLFFTNQIQGKRRAIRLLNEFKSIACALYTPLKNNQLKLLPRNYLKPAQNASSGFEGHAT